jgi:hypothetical protein
MSAQHLFDYRVTLGYANSEDSDRFVSTRKIEEGQEISALGRRCLVSNVAPGPHVPGEAQIVSVLCVAVDR